MPRKLDLLVDHRYMCEVGGWVSPELERWIDSHSRLPAVVIGRAATLVGARSPRFYPGPMLPPRRRRPWRHPLFTAPG